MRPIKRFAEPHHNVYVIELDAAVLNVRRFRKQNPDHEPGKACVYVGMTGLDPTARFENHRRGHKSSALVKRFAMRLREDLYRGLNPMRYKDATKMERALAARLRDQGLAVWQN